MAEMGVTEPGVPVVEPTTGGPRKRRNPCHTVAENGRGLCGVRLSGGKGGGKARGTHSHATCVKGGHERCEACDLIREVDGKPKGRPEEQG